MQQHLAAASHDLECLITRAEDGHRGKKTTSWVKPSIGSGNIRARFACIDILIHALVTDLCRRELAEVDGVFSGGVSEAAACGWTGRYTDL